MKKNKILILLFFLCSQINAQDSLLTIDQALKIALENNYDVKIAQSDKVISSKNNSAGNAGMLPSVDLSGSYSRSVNSINQKYSNGTEINRDNAGSSALGADAGLTWTIFDGMKMFHTKNRLEELYKISDQSLRIRMEETIESVITAYYSIVKTKQDLKALEEELQLSADRLRIAERKLNNGSGSKMDMLLAKTDYNAQMSSKLSLENTLEAARINLNVLLARPVSNLYMLADTVIVEYKPDLNDLLKNSESRNSSVVLYSIKQKIAELSLKENQSMRWPKISLGAHYLYNKSENDAGFSLLNQSNGFNYGITASLPLFHGFTISRQIENSKQALLSAKLELAAVKQSADAELLVAYRNFTSQMEILRMEEDNISSAREILTVAQERYKIGVSSSVEIQDAQRVYETSVSRLTTARYSAKLAEVRLRKLNGELVTTY